MASAFRAAILGAMDFAGHPRTPDSRRRNRILLGDLILALAFLLVALMFNMSTDPSSEFGLLFPGQPIIGNALVCTSAIPLILRRIHPETAAWMYVAVTVCGILFYSPLAYTDLIAPAMLYSVLVYGRPRHSTRFIVAACALGVLLSAAGVWSLRFPPLFASDGTSHAAYAAGTNTTVMLRTGATLLICSAVCIVTGIIAATWQRARMVTVRAMRERNEAIAARAAEEQRVAAAAERARIARDMHDVVAHTLSTIIIQSDGGRYAGANDIDTARETMTTIRQEALRAKHDMAKLFDIFKGAHETDYANIDVLIDQAQVPVTRTVTNDPHPERLSVKANEALYRLVQESLSNVRKYAGPGAHVEIHEIWSEEALFVAIADDGQGAKANEDGHLPGYGLIGMRERIAAVDGEVEAGPQPNEGFSVRATLPLSSATASIDHEEASIPLVSKVVGIVDAIRPKPLVTAGSRDKGWVSKLSHWTERHYMLVDASIAVALILCSGDFMSADGSMDSPSCRGFFVLLIAPLAFRRRFPEASAFAVALLSLVQLLFLPSISVINMLALVSVYSAVLYGRDRSWRWVGAALLLDSWLAGVKVISMTTTPLIMLLIHPERTERDTLLAGFVPGAMIAIMGLGCILLARWTRSLGSNALVLQQHEEALRAEEQQQKIMAANMERERIAAAIRTEVAQTLDTVIEQADAGLAMLESRDEGEPPTPQRIADAFKAIGDQGRKALAHMRQLLAVLRRTGFSDEPNEHHDTGMLLHPAASLDEQIRSNHLDGMTES